MKVFCNFLAGPSLIYLILREEMNEILCVPFAFCILNTNETVTPIH